MVLGMFRTLMLLLPLVVLAYSVLFHWSLWSAAVVAVADVCCWVVCLALVPSHLFAACFTPRCSV